MSLISRVRCDHTISDPLEFNNQCDDSLPLETLITPNPATRKLLQDIDHSRVSVWAATNAYITVRFPLYIHIFWPTNLLASPILLSYVMMICRFTPHSNENTADIQHAERVLKILQLRDLVDGIIYCDYKDPNFNCKPEPEYYEMVSD